MRWLRYLVVNAGRFESAIERLRGAAPAPGPESAKADSSDHQQA
ncbi:MAG: hypothetical protein ACOYNF_04930 [Rhodoferax sp.]